MILFVCTGNTCRSPMAAALANAIGLEAVSAGLSPMEGQPASRGAMREMKARKLSLEEHLSRRVTRAMVLKAESVYCMTETHRALLIERYPEAAAKIIVLSPEIADPYGGDETDYAVAAIQLESAVNAIKTARRAQEAAPERPKTQGEAP